ncbi:hypothetical protein H4R20_002822 [Coemansia guatemalensis]|uniref:CUE domain-containing protein n=1 Tax=Coemansia guatemalensis TaxID=2761395 RepID=A0A9W8LUN0_9FUNG|nr:hypothetical protein H4R20_002822 [Coemansia guatemalensis]
MTNDYSEGMKALTELFPEMDTEVIETILSNNSGQVEPSVNALLSLSDPEYKPDEADSRRLKNIEEDAAVARRLAEADLSAAQRQPYYPAPGYANNSTVNPHMRKSSAPPFANNLSWSPHKQPQQQQQKKKTSKIRDIFRRSRRSDGASTSEPPPAANAAEVGNPDRYVRPSHTLESDFSDTSSSANSNTSNGHSQPVQQRREGDVVDIADEDNRPLAFAQPLQQQNLQPTQQQQQNQKPYASPANDLFGLYEDPISSNSLASYEPLSPSKCLHAKPADISAPSSPTKQQQQTPPPPFSAVATDHAKVDLNNPFDDNPLLHAASSATDNNNNASSGHAGNITNPFAAAPSEEPANRPAVDTNPFRNRLNI